MPELKRLRVEVKDPDQGLVEAIFSRFDVIDADGDVTRRGAFADGASVRISAYGHASWAGALPVGRGVIRVQDDVAILDGAFFLETAHGRDHFEVVKQMGDLQEWSYGFDVDRWSAGQFDGREVRFLEALTVHEVSPVLLGAGVETGTLSVKGLAFTQEADAALAAVDALIVRSEALAALRAKDGRAIGTANRQRLSDLADRLRAGLVEIDALLADSDREDVPAGGEDAGKGIDPAGLRAFLETVRTRHVLTSREG